MTWKAVSYLNLQPTRDLWRNVNDHYRQVILYCQKLEKKAMYHYTDCSSFTQYVGTKAQYIDDMKELVLEYLQPEQQSNRRKRGVLDFVGEISKILFGTLTQSDAKEYNEHISQLEKKQKEFLHISSEQMTVIKSAIQSIDSTIQRVDKNEKLLRITILQLNEQVVNVSTWLQTEIEQVTTANAQMTIVERGVMECQHAFEILSDA
jgi:methyl-accepting chemotaxis protein